MNLGFKYIFGGFFAIAIMIFGFIFPDVSIVETRLEKSQLDSLVSVAKVNAKAYQKINNSIDSVNTVTDSLNEANSQDIGKINDALGYKDNFLVSEKDSIIVYIKNDKK